MQTMKAVRFHDYGDLDVLRYEDAPRPEPAAGELLVRVAAAGVNPVDWKIVAGYMRTVMPLQMPQIVGLDFCGTVERVATTVPGFAAGDMIYGRARGAYAQYCVLKPGDAAKKPSTVDATQAAALPTVALTAWQALFDAASLQQGQTVLIHGATGGVGSLAVQLAKWKGARVIATASGDHVEEARKLGADTVVDYKKQRFEDAAHDVDVVLDIVGGETQARSLAVLRSGGVLVSTVGVQHEDEARKRGVRAVGMLAQTDARVLTEVARLVDEKVLTVPVSEVMPLERAREALEKLKSGHMRGKIVLKVA